MDRDSAKVASHTGVAVEVATRSTATSPPAPTAPAPTPLVRVEKDLRRLDEAHATIDNRMRLLRDHLTAGNGTGARKSLLEILQMINAVNGMVLHTIGRFEYDTVNARSAIMAASTRLFTHNEHLARLLNMDHHSSSS